MTLAHEVSGARSGPPLVLLASVGATGQMWRPCRPVLDEHFRVITIEARGHGGSPSASADAPGTIDSLADDVLGVLDELGVARAHFAGVSLGAMTAAWLAARHPMRVQRLVLLCSTGWPDPETFRARAAQVRRGGMATVADLPGRLWITAELARRDPGLLAELSAMLTDVEPEGYAQCCEALAGVDLRPELARIVAPTLVIAGADDPAVSVATMRELADGIAAGARLEVLSPAAHLAPVEQPGRVAALLSAHLAQGDRTALGLLTRREVLGDEHVDRATAATTDFTTAFQDFITRYAWGEVWTRPGLDRRDRSLITLATLTALGAETEIAMHVRAARSNGLSAAQISEILLHTAVYAGLPRANRAFAIAQAVLRDEATSSDAAAEPLE